MSAELQKLEKDIARRILAKEDLMEITKLQERAEKLSEKERETAEGKP